MLLTEPVSPSGMFVFFHDPSRPSPQTLRRAIVAGYGANSGLVDLYVYSHPILDRGLNPIEWARDVELLASPQALVSPVHCACWIPPALAAIGNSRVALPPEQVEALASADHEARARNPGPNPAVSTANPPSPLKPEDLEEVAKAKDGIVRVWASHGPDGTLYLAGAEKSGKRQYLRGSFEDGYTWTVDLAKAACFTGSDSAMDALEASPRPVIDSIPVKRPKPAAPAR